MSDDAPAQAEITEVRDTHTGATLHLEGLSDRAARYVAWRHWFAMVDTDIPAGKRGHAELARLEVTPTADRTPPGSPHPRTRVARTTRRAARRGHR